MNKKKLFIGSMIVLPFMIIILFLIIATGLLFFAVISGAIFSLTPTPPEPEVKYGEFPISIIYEINGEIKEVKDTIICEFDGINNYGSGGKRRKWKSYLKSGNERLVLLKIDETTELYCNYGLPEYYMDDLVFQTKNEYEKMRDRDLDSSFIILCKMENGESKSSFISAVEAWEKYKLKILDVQYSQPIHNAFR